MISCNHKLTEVPYQSSICNAQPPFVKRLGYDVTRSAFTTSEKNKKGIYLKEIALQPGQSTRLYHDTTWLQAGWLGPILTDNKGNTWATPVPVINVLDNPTDMQNTVYRIDGTTGKMVEYIKLPKAKIITDQNPYGILGIAYNCEAQVLYVSSVAGSTRQLQQGAIYAINTSTATIQGTLQCGDVFGLGISYKEGYRKLYYGSARNSNVYSVSLNEDGNFIGAPQLALTLNGLGPRGDDKAKKIREDKQGNLVVSGYEFNFNLTAPTEIQETKYTFQYNLNTEKWELINTLF